MSHFLGLRAGGVQSCADEGGGRVGAGGGGGGGVGGLVGFVRVIYEFYVFMCFLSQEQQEYTSLLLTGLLTGVSR